jgi:GTP pyrophosphokinase
MKSRHNFPEVPFALQSHVMQSDSLQSNASAVLQNGALQGEVAPTRAATPSTSGATEASTESVQIVARARAFSQPLLSNQMLDTGENILAHADAMAVIFRSIAASQNMQAACYLVYAFDALSKPQEIIAQAFGDNLMHLAMEASNLLRLQRRARLAHREAKHAGLVAPMAQSAATQTESVRKMLLAFSRDLRVVLLRLASRLQTLRYYAATKLPPPSELAREALHVFAPLANRLGIWEIKWEIEDLAFRFIEPQTYKQIARLLDEKRTSREILVEQLRQEMAHNLQQEGIAAKVQGRPKHIYSIVKKMRGKSLGFEQVYDIRALRIVVPSVPDCYAALSWVHSHFVPIEREFDDYIARPKSNGYQSLHTVVRDAQQRPIEIQLRTQAMHDHAEHGHAAHWVYKEAGAKGYGGVVANGSYDAKIAVLRQLLAWQRDVSAAGAAQRQTAQEEGGALLEDSIYVLTPDAAIIELPQGATPVDFAYSVHTNLGHRCRGAKVDEAMVPLNTPLKNGQTVEITAAKEGGPSRDWLNAELGFLASHRARVKVRAWFNAQAMDATVAKGREAIEKLLQREGKTSLKLETLAAQMGLRSAQALFETVGKDALSLRSIEMILRPPVSAPEEHVHLKKSRADQAQDPAGVLVVGVGSLMTQLAQCCRPAPPDAVAGFVTRGKGVSVHRMSCSNLRHMMQHHAERCIEVAWGSAAGKEGSLYAVDIVLQAHERKDLLRDILEILAKDKANVTAMQTQCAKGVTTATLTLEVVESGRVGKIISSLFDIYGVIFARRR